MRHRQALYWAQQETTDPLTQVANGLHFDAFLQQQWERHCQDQAPISLILCSPDSLRTYYQIYGQQAGDAAFAALQASPAFRQALARAKAERAAMQAGR